MLNETGRLKELIDIMKEKKINIFDLSETKWLVQGRKKLRDMRYSEKYLTQNGWYQYFFFVMLTEFCVKGRNKENIWVKVEK
jgi:hypothetical protein